MEHSNIGKGTKDDPSASGTAAHGVSVKKRSGSEKRKRVSPIHFRATPEERARIEAAADRAGLTLGSYVRSRCLKVSTTRAVRRPPVATAQLAQLLGILGAASADIQRIAQQDGNDSIQPATIEAALGDFREAAAAILKALGKRP
jgi:hypothetical protein